MNLVAEGMDTEWIRLTAEGETKWGSVERGNIVIWSLL